MIRDGRAVCEGHVARGAGLAAAIEAYGFVGRRLIDLEAPGLPLRTWRFEDLLADAAGAAPRSTTSAASTAAPPGVCLQDKERVLKPGGGVAGMRKIALLQLRGDGPAHARRRQRQRAGADAGRGARRDHRALPDAVLPHFGYSGCGGHGAGNPAAEPPTAVRAMPPRVAPAATPALAPGTGQSGASPIEAGGTPRRRSSPR